MISHIFFKPRSDKNKNSVYSFYEISKNSGINPESSIRKAYTSETPYIKIFREIYDISLKKSSEDLTDCNLYHSYNSMRKIFEEFLKFKYTKPILPQQNQIDKIVYVIETSTGEQYGKKQKIKLSTFLSSINVMSHKPITAETLIEDSKFFMKLIEKVDKTHYNSIIH